jgi:hypothetical protein
MWWSIHGMRVHGSSTEGVARSNVPRAARERPESAVACWLAREKTTVLGRGTASPRRGALTRLAIVRSIGSDGGGSGGVACAFRRNYDAPS